MIIRMSQRVQLIHVDSDFYSSEFVFFRNILIRNHDNFDIFVKVGNSIVHGVGQLQQKLHLILQLQLQLKSLKIAEKKLEKHAKDIHL